ncbi:GNAT family N-acetyltransferase [Streptomyces sp. NPDC004232]|uniref:GNAT family N-acetyltransferase n=1 Tax=Streptomyces sp. NPDC004232 TaxID=3154454 RepID=UPI0033A11712
MTKPVRTVHLEPPTEDEFGRWIEPQIRDCARSYVRAGTPSPEEVLTKACECVGRLLPNGVATPGHHLWVARDEETGERVGRLWIEMRSSASSPEAFIHFVGVDENEQGKGYDRAMMNAGVVAARRLGAASIAWNVYGENTTAYDLCSSLGHRSMGQTMRLEF